MGLIGERVMLRAFRQEDISGMRSWAVDEEAARQLGSVYYTRPQTWEQTEAELNAYLSGDAGGANLVIADRASGRYLGQCSLTRIDNLARTAELALVMAPDSRGHGCATEGVRLMLRFAFERLNLRRVWLKAFADNAAAIRVYEKAGFEREGVLRGHLFRDGQYVDAVVMGIVKE